MLVLDIKYTSQSLQIKNVLIRTYKTSDMRYTVGYTSLEFL